jgi:hypothetical protein
MARNLYSQSKYRNRRTTINGITFSSKREANRYLELKLLERVGEVQALSLQVPFDLDVKGRHICKYIADFVYADRHKNQIVEDVKGVKTPVYQIKKKLMKAIYYIDIQEV